MAFGQFTGTPLNPWQSISVLKTGDRQNATFNNDAKFDAMYQSILDANAQDEAKKLTAEVDMYFLQQNWIINTFPIATAVVTSPRVRNYVGEFRPGMFYYSRWWLDQSVK